MYQSVIAPPSVPHRQCKQKRVACLNACAMSARTEFDQFDFVQNGQPVLVMDHSKSHVWKRNVPEALLLPLTADALDSSRLMCRRARGLLRRPAARGRGRGRGYGRGRRASLRGRLSRCCSVLTGLGWRGSGCGGRGRNNWRAAGVAPAAAAACVSTPRLLTSAAAAASVGGAASAPAHSFKLVFLVSARN